MNSRILFGLAVVIIVLGIVMFQYAVPIPKQQVVDRFGPMPQTGNGTSMSEQQIIDRFEQARRSGPIPSPGQQLIELLERAAVLPDAASCMRAWNDVWRVDLTKPEIFRSRFYQGILSVGFKGSMSDQDIKRYVAEQGLSFDSDYPNILDFSLGADVKAVRLLVPEGKEVEWVCKLTGNRRPMVQVKTATVVFAGPVGLPAALPQQ